ncbi:MAG TPA: alpha-N-acetylglucosaminidase [Candidatus Kryptonia bacterium]
MKRLVLLILVFVSHRIAFAVVQYHGAFPGVEKLIERIIPQQAGEIRIDSISSQSGKEMFEVGSEQGEVVIRGSSPSAAAFALNYYLKYVCHCSISRMGMNLKLPAKLPLPAKDIREETPFEYRYFFNYCTFNYSMSWYRWKDWEKELDWMALNGVNLALAVTGTEKVWQNVLKQYGFSQKEILEFIPGPAYTAWWLMGNLEKWRGPVSQKYIDERSGLQKRILERMKELGISPVYQGFYGMVPTLLKQKFPNHHIVDQGLWGNFQRPDILDPSDSLFAPMARTYYRELTRLYGKSDFYGGDPFHEGGKTDDIDVEKAASLIQGEMLKENQSAVWVLQGWQQNPKEELLAGIDRSHALVLDLNAESEATWETRNAYEGTPWLWCNILYYGDNTFMYGKLDSAAGAPTRALKTPEGKYLKGIGFLMEGFDNDPVNYDLFFEAAWDVGKINVPEWIKGFTYYRYGKIVPAAEEAWEILYKTIYSEPAPTDPIVCARPASNADRVVTWSSSKIWIDNSLLEKAAQDLLDCSNQLRGVDSYQYDLVSVTRQYISNLAHGYYAKCMKAYESKDVANFTKYSKMFLDVISDLDTLLGTRKEYLLGSWIESARELGRNVGEEDLFELNARTLITVWGDSAAAQTLHDYSFREWSGMLRGFYGPRWKLFFESLQSGLEGQPVHPINYYSWEDKWCHGTEKYDSKPAGDPVEVSARMLAKYPITER